MLVVRDDAVERAVVARAEEVRVRLDDVHAGDVPDALATEDLALDAGERARRQAVPVNAARHVEQVEVRRLRGSLHAVHHEARAEQRHVERLAVVGHDHRGVGEPPLEQLQDRGLLAEPAEEQLLEHERLVRLVEEREPHEESDRPRAAGEACRLRVEVQRAPRIARGEGRIEREEAERPRVRVPRGDERRAPDAPGRRRADPPHVERPGGRALHEERELPRARIRPGSRWIAVPDERRDAGPKLVQRRLVRRRSAPIVPTARRLSIGGPAPVRIGRGLVARRLSIGGPAPVRVGRGLVARRLSIDRQAPVHRRRRARGACRRADRISSEAGARRGKVRELLPERAHFLGRKTRGRCRCEGGSRRQPSPDARSGLHAGGACRKGPGRGRGIGSPGRRSRDETRQIRPRDSRQARRARRDAASAARARRARCDERGEMRRETSARRAASAARRG